MGETPGVRVRLHRYAGRPYGLIWQAGQRSGEVSSGTTNRREAERAAGRLEEKLMAGQLPGNSVGIAITWADFRKRYEREWLEHLSHGSQAGWQTAVTHFERIAKPKHLYDVDKSLLSRFRGELENITLAEESRRSYYRAIRAALGWAESVDLIDTAPTIRQRRKAKRSSGMRSRPITTEEFERMLTVTEAVRPKDHKPLVRFMRGLWFSGLRLDELNRLSWDLGTPLHIDTRGKLPLIVFLGGQKSKADTYLPAPPEFWEEVHRRGYSRRGPVFWIDGRYPGTQVRTKTLSRQISDIGKAAGIVVDPQTKKCATAHDLRRAYLTGIASKGTMSQTQAFARHADPSTTSQFYVRHQAEELADAMGWR